MRIATLSSLIIRSFFIFIIAYLWLSFYIRDFFLSFIISFLIACVLNYVFLFFEGRKRKRKRLSSEAEKHMRTITLQLRFMTEGQSTDLINRAIKAKKNGESDEVFNCLEIFCMFHKDVRPQDVIDCLNKTPAGKKTVILSNAFAPDVTGFFDNLKLEIEFMDAFEVYTELLEPTKIFPKVTIEQKSKSRITIAALRARAFSRKKVKSYVLIGIVVLLTSLIVRPTIFYMIASTIIFTLAIISFFRPTRTKALFD